MQDTSFVIKYWISTDTPLAFPDLDGVEEFRAEMSSSYLAVVKGRPAGAGGVASLWIEIVSSISLTHLAQLLLDGIAFDLIKSGAHSFILRPFLNAYRKLKDKNRERHLEIQEIKIEFQDCILVLHSLYSAPILDNLEAVLRSIAGNWNDLRLTSGELPFEIHISVLEDTTESKTAKFRVIGEIDETITSDGAKDYFGYWGIIYDRALQRRVYDVNQRMLIDEPFHTLNEHWAEVERRMTARS